METLREIRTQAKLVFQVCIQPPVEKQIEKMANQLSVLQAERVMFSKQKWTLKLSIASNCSWDKDQNSNQMTL